MITRHVLSIPGYAPGDERIVHYRRCGSGPALLMVHQSPRNSAEYAPLMKQWGAHFTCIAPDTPGFGQSDPLPGTPGIDDFADALVEFLDVLGLTRCAAYGFHSGGIILMAAVRRNPQRFSCLAIGGYAIWTPEEMRVFGEHYLPEFRPEPYGQHLAWLWHRMLEQSWFFPWFDVRDDARLSVAHADLPRVHQAVMEMLDAGDAYRAGYGAVLRAPRDIPAADAAVPPLLITAYDGDPLQPHLDRLGALPRGWLAHAVRSPAEHQASSLAFLQLHAEQVPSPALVEDPDQGWLMVGDGLIHWRGARGADRLTLHGPADEMGEPEADAIAIDAPGHGLSNDFADMRAAVEDAARAFGAEIAWPVPPIGEIARLYPDLTPDRFGGHLHRAWGAARAETLFRPWYAAGRDTAIPVDSAALEPRAIALRARARLRADAAAPRWHRLLGRIALDADGREEDQ